jgi:hypothetical protein
MQLMHLIGDESPLRRGNAVIFDEAQFALGARNWQNREQIGVTNLLQSIRSQGFIVLIVALHRNVIDKAVREHIIDYHVSMTRPGIGVPRRPLKE